VILAARRDASSDPTTQQEDVHMKQYRIPPGARIQLDKMDPDDTGAYKKSEQGKEKAKAITAELTRQLGELRKNELAKEELIRAKAEADRLRKELDDKSRQLAALKGGEAETAVQQRQQIIARADANELLTRTWQVPAGTKDDIVTQVKAPSPEEREKFRATLQEALRLDPDNPWAHLKMGYLYHSEGNLDAAIREYRTTIHLKPDAARPHLALGRALKAQGKKQEAAEEMYAYLMLAEKNPANKPLIERTERKIEQLNRKEARRPRR